MIAQIVFMKINCLCHFNCSYLFGVELADTSLMANRISAAINRSDLKRIVAVLINVNGMLK